MSFELETSRLIIRDIREEDLPILIEQFAEPESRSAILSFQADAEHNKKILASGIAWAKQPQRQYYKLAVTLKEGGDMIGSCTVTDVRPGCFETAVGWHYGHRYRNHGYATEAARELLRIGFELGRVNKIYADCFADNKASMRVLEKIGMNRRLDFGFFNLMRGWHYGESKPTLRYVISREQWQTQTK